MDDKKKVKTDDKSKVKTDDKSKVKTDDKRKVKTESLRKPEEEDYIISWVEVISMENILKPKKILTVEEQIKNNLKKKEKTAQEKIEEDRIIIRKKRKQRKIKKIYRSIFIHQILEMILNINLITEKFIKIQQKYIYMFFIIFFINVILFGYFCIFVKQKISKKKMQLLLTFFFITDVYMSNSLMIFGNDFINRIVISIFSSACFSSFFVLLLTFDDKNKFDKKIYLLFISYPNLIFHVFFGFFVLKDFSSISISLCIILFFGIGSVFYINFLIKYFQNIGSSNIILKVLISVYALPNFIYILFLIIYFFSK